MSLSFILFLIGILTNNNRTRGHISSLFASFIVLLFFIFTILYIAADYFTDEGINDAVIYHIIYGVEGAGFKEYSLIIWFTIVLFLLTNC